MRGTSVILAATIAALSAGPAHADEPAQDPPAKSQPPDDDDLTSAQWRKPRPPLDLHWHLLALPEYVVQLAFTPVAMLVTAVERYRLDKRLIDLFIITENIKLTPDVKLAGGEGVLPGHVPAGLLLAAAGQAARSQAIDAQAQAAASATALLLVSIERGTGTSRCSASMTGRTRSSS